MPPITLAASTEFALRMKAALLAERPDLVGATNTVITEQIRLKMRQFARDWVNRHELVAAAEAARNSVVYPTDTDIT